jgi:hypothetical protein
MRISTISRFGLASLLGSLATLTGAAAHADVLPPPAAPCDPAALTCSVGTTELHAQIRDRLPTQIDSGLMDKGLIKIRTRFTIDPVGTDPLFAIDMPKGAMVQASWTEKGYVSVKTLAQQGVQGSMNAHYTLVPSLEASIYGIAVNYNANDLINKIPGAAFNYNAKATTAIAPWGFPGALLTVPAPALDQSTIFAIPFSDLGVDPGIVEGTLSIQAAASPTFKYVTKAVRIDAGTITTADGASRIPVGDDDFLDIGASVNGDLTLGGTMDIRPVINVSTVDGFPTFGLVKYSFSAVSKPIGDGTAMPVTFQNTNIHIPLPNVKVPTAGVQMGTAKAGQSAEKVVTIDSTGELGGKLRFESSDPQFVVPSGEVLVGAKSKYDLKIAFKPTSDSAATATITVRSNDPGDPEQTFTVGANGASVGDSNDGTTNPRQGGVAELDPPPSAGGCAVGPVGNGALGGYGALGLGLGLAALVRRRRSR